MPVYMNSAVLMRENVVEKSGHITCPIIICTNHSQAWFWRGTAEIHLCSLIGACTCMRAYMNSAVLIMMRENVAEKNVYAISMSENLSSANNHVGFIRTS